MPAGNCALWCAVVLVRLRSLVHGFLFEPLQQSHIVSLTRTSYAYDELHR